MAKEKTANRISMFFHCSKCLEEIPEGVSPREWARLEVGWTKEGLQVWCKRHEMNVVDLDFLGQKVGLRPDLARLGKEVLWKRV